MNHKKILNSKMNVIYYVRIFVVLFSIELIVEGVGYQIVGRWIYNKIWSTGGMNEQVIHLFWMLVISTPILYGWIISQLRRQRRYTNILKEKENEFMSLFSHNSDAIVAFDLVGKISKLNPAAEKMLGYSLKELVHMDTQAIYKIMGKKHAEHFFQQALKGETQEYDNNLIHRDGHVIRVLEKSVPIIQDDQVVGVYVIDKDITEQIRIEQKVWNLAHYDNLTKLPNRRYFIDRLYLALDEVQRQTLKFAVIFIDLDRFKYINDALGHSVGDEVLKVVSNRMSGCLRENDVLARFGGDEFALFLPNIAFVNETEKVVQRILQSVQDCIEVDGHELYLTTSIGIAMYPFSGETPKDLLRNADSAMYEAKRHGKNQYYIHLTSMHEHAYERFRLENDLRKALKMEDELFLEYQPQVNVTTGKVVSAEALLRWRHPIIGVIPPGDFIPLAEESDLIEQISNHVFKKVIRQMKDWDLLGKELIPITVNVSPIEIDKEDFVHRFRGLIKDLHVPPEYIAIEITESTLTKNERSTRVKLQELLDMGIKIYMDDFGRGYSSLGLLKNYPVDVMKVDAIFVRELDTNSEDTSIVSAIVTLAHARGMKVIAEGVEREQQLDVLKQLQCDEFQGYLYSRPVPAGVFGEMYL